MRLLPLLSAHYDADIVYCDMTLHSLVSALSTAPLSEAFANVEFCDVVFTKFFVVSSLFDHILTTCILFSSDFCKSKNVICRKTAVLLYCCKCCSFRSNLFEAIVCAAVVKLPVRRCV